MHFSETIFEALASSVRRRILVHLADAELKAGDISSHFTTSKASISQHLSILESAGLVISERRGQYIFYRQLTDTLFDTLYCFMQEACPGKPTVLQDNALAQQQLPTFQSARIDAH